MKHLEAFSFYNRFNKYDKLVNTIFQNIKLQFDIDNLSIRYINGQMDFLYKHIDADYKKDVELGTLPYCKISIDDDEIECSKIMHDKIFNFFKYELDNKEHNIKLNKLRKKA